MENKNIIAYIFAALALLGFGIGGYLLYDEMQRRKAAKLGSGADTADPTVDEPAIEPVKEPAKPKPSTGGGYVVKPTTTTSIFPLQKGSRGVEVKYLQYYLNSRYKAGLVEDGIFGSNTEAALRKNYSTTSVSSAEYKTMTTWMDKNWAAGKSIGNNPVAATLNWIKESADLA